MAWRHAVCHTSVHRSRQLLDVPSYALLKQTSSSSGGHTLHVATSGLLVYLAQRPGTGRLKTRDMKMREKHKRQRKKILIISTAFYAFHIAEPFIKIKIKYLLLSIVLQFKSVK